MNPDVKLLGWIAREAHRLAQQFAALPEQDRFDNRRMYLAQFDAMLTEFRVVRYRIETLSLKIPRQ